PPPLAGGASTVTVTVSLLASSATLVASIVVTPTPTAVTSPASSTVATAALALDHSTSSARAPVTSTFAVSCAVWPTGRRTVSSWIWTDSTASGVPQATSNSTAAKARVSVEAYSLILCNVNISTLLIFECAVQRIEREGADCIESDARRWRSGQASSTIIGLSTPTPVLHRHIKTPVPLTRS